MWVDQLSKNLWLQTETKCRPGGGGGGGAEHLLIPLQSNMLENKKIMENGLKKS